VGAHAREIARRKRLEIVRIHFHGVALHNLFHGHDYAEAVLVANDNAFQALEGAGPNPHALADRNQRVWLRGSQFQARAQFLNRRIRKRSRLASGSSH
jgi:hypothetical protein